jgi:orotidine-5'-phosphate decarboxylase
MTPPPILVALDTPTAGRALALASELAPHVAGFKVGLELLMGPGPGLIADLGRFGRPIFVDAKLHDIPNTVAAASRQLGEAGARWVTVHASGGRRMMEAAVSGLAGGAGNAEAGILAVTVLTSLSDLAEIGIHDAVGGQVDRMARLAAAAGVEGVVCSPLEIETCMTAAPGLTTVVPGIRPGGSEHHDQARVATPEEAIGAGADYLVIGRAITMAADPAATAAAIGKSILERREPAG